MPSQDFICPRQRTVHMQCGIHGAQRDRVRGMLGGGVQSPGGLAGMSSMSRRRLFDCKRERGMPKLPWQQHVGIGKQLDLSVHM